MKISLTEFDCLHLYYVITLVFAFIVVFIVVVGSVVVVSVVVVVVDLLRLCRGIGHTSTTGYELRLY